MTYIPSTAFEEMSGSAKGVTAAKIKNQKYIRNRGYGGSVRTSDQAKVKGDFKRLTTMWETLANDNILAWNKLALSQQGRSVLGTGAKISGANLFTRLNYFLKDSGLELDFLVRMKGECVPLEVKAQTAQAKSVQTVLKHADKYHVKHIIKFGDYNVGREGQLLTLPNYMQFLLDLEPEKIVLEPIDVDAVNALAKKILG